ncbi:MAG: prepilin-type N-terminal cleavage/methylation domain-containing protein, partial [Kordiimonadaceae bacterium]|nr:prepilin-type N-terminal cleavage/methylation domain-containing protein [Kordiimonadaceae bacterium]
MSYFSLSNKKKLAADEGFSILELIVVLVVLSLIIGVAAPAIIGQFGSAKNRT